MWQADGQGGHVVFVTNEILLINNRERVTIINNIREIDRQQYYRVHQLRERRQLPLEYISHRVIPYDHASVFSLYVGFLLDSVSRVSGANHFNGTDVDYNNDT